MKPEIAVVITKANPPQLVPTLAEHFVVHPVPHESMATMAQTVRPFADRVRALVTGTLVGADATFIDALPALEIIVCPGGHVDKIDRVAARMRGIPVTNTPHVSAPDVADLAIAHLLAIARRIPEADAYVRSGAWRAARFGFGTRVSGKTIGIVGLGYIGRIVARRAEGLDMKVSYYGPRPKAEAPYPFYDDIVALARDVDVLSLHCHAGPATRHLVNRRVLEALGPKGILVNLSRGSVVDEEALIWALENGIIAGAGLDVFENEPYVPERLWRLANVTMTPHTGAFTEEAKQIMVDMALGNLIAHFRGEPLLSPLS